MGQLTNRVDLNRQATSKYGIPEGILYRLINLESGWNPRAISPSGKHFGLGQLGPGVRKDYGVKNPFDPAENLDVAAHYLRDLFDEFGRWDLAVAGYHAGADSVRKAGKNVPNTRDKYTGLPTPDYVKKIVGEDGSVAAGSSVANAANTVKKTVNFDLSGLKANPDFRKALILGTASVLILFAVVRMK